MQKYLVLYHASAAAMQAMMDSKPEDMKAVMESWQAWALRCGEGLVDMSPLSPRREDNGVGKFRRTTWES